MKLKKPLLIGVGIVIGIGVVMSVNAFTIQSNVLNAVATFQQFFVTTGGFAPNGSNEIVTFNQGLNGKVIFAANTVRFAGIDASGTGVVLATDSQGNLTTKIITGGTAPVSDSQWTGGVNITNTNTGLVIFSSGGAVRFSGIIATGVNQVLATDNNGNITVKNITGTSTTTGFSSIGNNLFYNSGNIGIGITNPTVKLHVVGDSILSGNTTIGNATTLIVTGGNVGIGMNNPLAKLHVVGNSIFNGIVSMGSTVAVQLYTYTRQSETNTCANFANYSQCGSPDYYGTVITTGLTTFYKTTGSNCGIFNRTTTDVSCSSAGNTRVWRYPYTSSVGPTLTNNLVFISGGNVGIGTSTPIQSLHVVGNILVQGTGATCTIGNGNGATSCTSDERLKKDIIPISDSLQKILSLTGIYYSWKDLSYGVNRHIGFLAQNVEKVFPELITEGSDGYKMLSMEGIIAPLVNAIKEQQTQINQLQVQINQLKIKN